MSSSIVEIATLSLGQVKDQNALVSALKTPESSNGSLKAYHGVQIEDKNVEYIALVWNSKDELDKWTGREAFDNIIGEPSSERLRLDLGEIDSSVSGAFEAKVTEFAFAKLKAEANREEFNATAASLGKQLLPSSYSPAFGPVTLGDAVDIAIIIGWDSPEAHMNAVKDLAGVAKLAELSQLSVVHSNFKKLL